MKRARTDQAKEERRAIILQSALNEFYEKGFSAARTDDIAHRAGLSKGTLYLYFKSKSELFMGIIDSLAGPQLENVEKLVSEAESLEGVLRTFARNAPKMITQTDMPKLLKVLIGESQAFPSIVETYRTQILDRVLGAFTQLLTEANERGEIEVIKPELTARLIVAPIVLSSVWQAVFADAESGSVNLDALFQIHVDMMIKAFRVR